MKYMMNSPRFLGGLLAVAWTFLSCVTVNAAEKSGASVSVKGSDTMVNLAAAWAEAYMTANPGARVAVTGGGSGVGIAGLLNGTTDIATSSRSIKKEEKAQAKQSGLNVKEIAVARDGIALVVNPANPVNELTHDQLKQIYTGAISNWKELGGPDQKLVVLSRESSSGTYQFFQEHILQNEDYAASVMMMPATSAIIEAVASDKWDIGYVGLGYAVKAKDRVKLIKIKANGTAPAVEPSDESVRSGAYTIARPLFMYMNDRPGTEQQKFVNFCLSDDGQKIVPSQGYVALK